MIPTVRIAFDLSLAGAGSFLTLDDPVKGVLDGATYKLAGDVYVDVSDDVRSVSVRRGRSRELTAFTAGQASVVLDNRARLYDPTNMPTVAARTNLVTNPSFEVDTAGWIAIGSGSLARTTSDSKIGAASALITKSSGDRVLIRPGSGGQDPVVTAGLTYTLSAYVRVPAGNETTPLRVWLDYRSAANGYVGAFASITQNVTAADGWVRLSISGMAPALTTWVDAYVIQEGTGTAGQTWLVDAVLLEESATLNPYFDGTSKDGSIQTVTQVWNGTPDASTSRITYYVTGTGSAYAPSILPRKAIAIEVGGESVFTGVVEDWDLQFTLDGDATTSAKCTDGFTLLAGETITAGTATPQVSGARVETVLDDVDWPAGKRRIATGVTSLGADVVAENVTALSYLQTVDISEGGGLFIAKDGSIEFLERTDAQVPATVSFTDDGAGVPFSDISLEFGTETLYTNINIEYVGGTAIVTAPTETITKYGLIDFNVKTLLADEIEAANVADFYLFRYSTPLVRINGLEVRINGLTPAQQSQVLSLELGDPVGVVFTPQGIGSPIEQTLVVDQIEHSMTPADHNVRFNFSQTLTGFILDTDRLDTGRLGF